MVPREDVSRTRLFGRYRRDGGKIDVRFEVGPPGGVLGLGAVATAEPTHRSNAARSVVDSKSRRSTSPAVCMAIERIFELTR